MTNPPTPTEPIYVVDTNALIWYLTADKKLSRRAAEIFTAAESGAARLLVSAITIAELYYANQKWEWFDDFNQVYQDLQSKPYFQLVAFTADDVLQFALDSSIPEMHDRIIAGLAQRLEAPLLTSDSLIAEANAVRIVW